MLRTLRLSAASLLALAIACGGSSSSSGDGGADGRDDSVPRDIVDLGLESPGGAAASDLVLTFGHVFAVGEISPQSILAGRLADGTEVPLQVDRKANHGDGSLRHAIITARIESLPAAGDTMTIHTGATAPGGNAVSLGDLLASDFDARVDLDIGGNIYSASAADLLANGSPTQWLTGPLVSEWLVGGPIETSGGAAEAHMAVYFHVRAYAGFDRVRVDVIVENGWTAVAAPGNRTYDATISVGDSDFTSAGLEHYAHARWHKRFWWGAEPSIYAKHDHDYLQSTRAIPRYEDLTPSEEFLNSVRSDLDPMDNGDQEENMQATGFQQGIGPLPRWDAVYAISADRRAFLYMLANADAGGSYSVHYRDENTGMPATIDDHPQSSLIDPVGSTPPFPEGGSNPLSQGNGASHQPSIGFLPYIVTGDYFYLEEAQLWTAYNLIWVSVTSRQADQGYWYTGSLRGQAWAYRSLGQVAYITPDAHPLKSYFVEKLMNNISHDSELYVSPGGTHKNNLGAMYMAEGNDEYRFYDYFMSWTIQYLVDLGFNEAVPLRDYKLQFPIGLMGMAEGEYCFQSAAKYTWHVGPPGTDAFFADFAEVYAATVPEGAGIACGTQAMADAIGVDGTHEMENGQDSTTYYFANLQPALAAAADSGLADGQEAWDRAHLSGVHPDYSDMPIWAVVPHGP